MRFFNRKPARGLESGMTMKEWDAIYGEEAFRTKMNRFRIPAILSGIIFLASLGVSVFSGTTAISRRAADVGLLSFLILSMTAPLYFMPWIMSLVDPPRSRKPQFPSRKRRKSKP